MRLAANLKWFGRMFAIVECENDERRHHSYNVDCRSAASTLVLALRFELAGTSNYKKKTCRYGRFIALLAAFLHAEGIVSMHIVYDYTNQNSAVRSPTRAAGCLRTQRILIIPCVALPLLLAVVSHKGNSLYRRPLRQRFKARSERFSPYLGVKNHHLFHFARWNLALRKSLIYITVRTSHEAVAPSAQRLKNVERKTPFGFFVLALFALGASTATGQPQVCACFTTRKP